MEALRHPGGLFYSPPARRLNPPLLNLDKYGLIPVLIINTKDMGSHNENTQDRDHGASDCRSLPCFDGRG